jgi:spore germination cell wall hydrolase CwlJ-like protein
MSRRSSRRIWRGIAAFVPFTLTGAGAVVVLDDPLATEVELELVRPNDGHAAVSMTVASSAGSVTTAGKQLIAASLAGSPSLLNPVSAVSREGKGDRLKPTSSEVALNVPEHRKPENSLFMNASYASPFNADFEVAAFRPSPEDIAYTPTPQALNFRYKGETQAEFEARERRCLAVAIYFEARGEPKRGQIAVGQVILNRVRSPLFPATICGVVYQGQMHKGCQFSFTCDGRTDNPHESAQWNLARSLAKEIMAGEQWLPEVGYSTYYHANYVRPNWAYRMNKIDRIGRHIFYKKRNEEPYLVEASTEPETKSESDEESGYLLPTLSLASAVSTVTGSVSAVAGSSTQTSSQAMSLGYAGSE